VTQRILLNAKLPPTGSVLGVDVGYSQTRRSSAVCRLDWDDCRITWTLRRFRAFPAEQRETIVLVAGQKGLEAAAFDGPLKSGLELINEYRLAERMLTKRLQSKIGKPGQASAPVGRALNAAANSCAKIVLAHCHMAPSSHDVAIDPRAIVEAFPTAFLGVMLDDPSSVVVSRRNRSDQFFQSLVAKGSLQRLFADLLPDRSLTQSFDGVTNHDDRAALVCAMTALCVASGAFSAVGDEDGWIVLPPRNFIRAWAASDLNANALEEQPGCYFTPNR
jgi:hypothetical protein